MQSSSGRFRQHEVMGRGSEGRKWKASKDSYSKVRRKGKGWVRYLGR